MHSLFGVSKAAADLMVQEYGRYFDMPTVCFRGGCLTGPSHAGAQAARLPLLPHALHGHAASRTRSSATAASRCATTSTRADVVARVPRLPRAPRGRRRSTTSAAGAQSNCSMLEAIALVRADRRARARLDARRDQARMGDHRWWISDLAEFQARLPGLGARRTTSRRSCARSTTHNVERWTARPRVKLSVVIPAHNEAGSIAATRRRGRGRARRGEDDRLRDRRRRRRVHATGPRDGRRRARGGRTRASAACARTTATASASRCAPGSTSSRATRSRSSWPTAPTIPRDLSRYYRLLEAGLRLRVRLALHAGRGRCSDYPRFKLVINRLVNLGIRVLFRHGYNDTTNAFKAYRREVIDNVQPLRLARTST